MEIISNFCTYEEDKEKIIPNFCIVAILFQNIAYTSSANYKKWFYNNYYIDNHNFIKRDRSYSLDENIDFDMCLTQRNRNSSMDTIYEEVFLGKEPLDVYYSPLTENLINLFDDYSNYFSTTIETIRLNNAKIKYFAKNNNIYITFIFKKDLKISDEKEMVKIYEKNVKVSKSVLQEWQNLQNNINFINLQNEMENYEKIIIVSHYKNCIFTDFIISQLRHEIEYIMIDPIFNYETEFYKKLNKNLDCFLFGRENICFLNFWEIKDNNTFPCCGCISLNYRKSLKKTSIFIKEAYLNN